MGFWNDRWEDIRGNLLWQFIIWIVGGGLFSAIAQAVRASQHIPFEWGFVAVVFVVSALTMAVITLLAARRRSKVEQQGTQSLSTTSVAQLSAKAIDDLYRSTDVILTKEAEELVRKLANEFLSGNERENFLVRFLTIGSIVFQFEITWYNIFASQIEALQQLNSGPLKREDLFQYYTHAAATYPHVYATYSFDQWIGYMRGQILLREDGDQINITVRGRAFLKYLIDNARSASGRTL